MPVSDRVISSVNKTICNLADLISKEIEEDGMDKIKNVATLTNALANLVRAARED